MKLPGINRILPLLLIVLLLPALLAVPARAEEYTQVDLDHPDKHQYSINDIVPHGGADLGSYLKPSASERYTMIKDMCEYVREHNIIEFHALMDYAMVEHFDDWFPALCDNSAYVVNQYIKSNRQRNQDEIYRMQRKGLTP